MSRRTHNAHTCQIRCCVVWRSCPRALFMQTLQSQVQQEQPTLPRGPKNAPGRASLSSTMLRAEATSYELLLLLGLGEALCNSRSPNSHPQSRPYPDHLFLNSMSLYLPACTPASRSSAPLSPWDPCGGVWARARSCLPPVLFVAGGREAARASFVSAFSRIFSILRSS